MSASETNSATEGHSEFVTFTIGGQLCGIPILSVRDVLSPQRITAVPLAPHEIAGSLNLRGRIVTAIDLRSRLGLPHSVERAKCMSVVVDHGGELYSLMVDSVGEVLRPSSETFERNPPTLDPNWRRFSEGVYRLKAGLLVVLGVDALLDYSTQRAAA